jgi:SAM-dependent methyltransferase
MDSKNKVSEIDERNLKFIRNNVSSFIQNCATKYDNSNAELLDIAPQDHKGAKPYFHQSRIETLDIDESSNATYIADICEDNSNIIPSDSFDYVVCTEVLEHTLQPFDAVNEIGRILKKGGVALISVPFNFRIHGPLPDCWRFTEHGLRELFRDFEIIKLNSLEDKDRFLMPIHYTLIVKNVRL